VPREELTETVHREEPTVTVHREEHQEERITATSAVKRRAESTG
jgi:hypothetical protein